MSLRRPADHLRSPVPRPVYRRADTSTGRAVPWPGQRFKVQQQGLSRKLLVDDVAKLSHLVGGQVGELGTYTIAKVVTEPEPAHRASGQGGPDRSECTGRTPRRAGHRSRPPPCRRPTATVPNCRANTSAAALPAGGTEALTRAPRKPLPDPTLTGSLSSIGVGSLAGSSRTFLESDRPGASVDGAKNHGRRHRSGQAQTQVEQHHVLHLLQVSSFDRGTQCQHERRGRPELLIRVGVVRLARKRRSRGSSAVAGR